jgi:Bacterial TSP3 repeat
MKVKSGLAMLAVIAGLTLMDCARADVPAIHPQDSHRLQQCGTTWYPVGYYPSMGALTADQNDYTSYYRTLIDKLADNNINYFRNVFTMGEQYGDSIIPYQRTGPGNAADGRPRYDLAQFDQTFFDYWFDVVSYAHSKNIVVQITLLDFWHNKNWIEESGSDITLEWGLKYDFYQGMNNVNGVDVATPADWIDASHPVLAVQKALIAKAIDTLGSLPNIIWEVANEASVSGSASASEIAWQLELADYITAYEQSIGVTPHLVIPRDIPNHESTPGQLQRDSPATIHDQLVARFSDGVPLISDNDCCTSPKTPAYQREKAWASLTAGAHLDWFYFSMYELSVLESQLVSDGMRYVGNLSRFIADLGVDLVGMVPADELVSNGWCYARPGDEYVIYLPSGGTTSVSGLPASFTATWFNPLDASTIPAGNGPQFTAPTSQDWALHSRSAPSTVEPDADGDGLSDTLELTCLGTDPNDVDSDNDGLADGKGGLVLLAAVPNGVDIDGDGFVDGEQELGTDPANSDSDSDGLSDGDEVALYGTNPAVSNVGDVGPVDYPDNLVNAGDLVVLTRLLTGAIQPTPLQRIVGDINVNGQLDVGDLFLLQQTIVSGTSTASP